MNPAEPRYPAALWVIRPVLTEAMLRCFSTEGRPSRRSRESVGQDAATWTGLPTTFSQVRPVEWDTPGTSTR
jgi:hypothetical protein